MSASTIFLMLAALFTVLTLLRCRIAKNEIDRYFAAKASPVSENRITALQPILGGDPALAHCLETNLLRAKDAHFIWLIDDDDVTGQEAAQAAIAKTGRSDVLLVIAPSPPANLNPKTYKLSCGLSKVKTDFIAVLDDDTILPVRALGDAAALAGNGSLVTGLPIYDARTTVWSRLVTGFVNANSLLTYLPAAGIGLSRTINGMFSLMRTEDLKTRGGFHSIAQEVTDDYALASLFLSQNGRVIQTCICTSLITTVQGPCHYFTLMHRWMVFARLYLRENLSLATLPLILVPGILPLPLCLSGLAAGGAFAIAAIALLVLKSLIVRSLVAKLSADPHPVSDFIFEILGELLLPLHVISSAMRPNSILWRKRSLLLKGSRIING